MKTPKWILRLLVKWGLMKPFQLYKGKKVTPFPCKGQETLLREYLKIRLKVSLLSADRRKFIVRVVEGWLVENNINPNSFSYDLLLHGS